MSVRPARFLPILMSLATAATGHEADPSRFNYRDHIRPIFVKHCGSCHRPGGVAPMSLLAYQDALPWANAIKVQVLQGQMPPWLPVEGIGEFRHARTLTAEEIDMLIDWAVGQTPEGEPLDEGEIESTGGWAMGEPDLVLRPDADVVLSEEESEKTACVDLETGLAAPRVATAFEVRPQRVTLLRRAAISLGACGGGRPLVTWLAGQGSVSYPEGTGTLLPERAHLAVELSYVKGWGEEGRRLTDRSPLGIRFEEGARPVETLNLDSASFPLSSRMKLLAIYPDASGKEPLRVDAVLPDGATEPLLRIERYDPRWREKYFLASPRLLSAGTRLTSSQSTVWIDFISE